MAPAAAAHGGGDDEEGFLEDALEEACTVCGVVGRCLHIRRHGHCGPHALCFPCSQQAPATNAAKTSGSSGGTAATKTIVSNGQFRCPLCSQVLGSRRRALVEGLLSQKVQEEQLVVYKKPRGEPDETKACGDGKGPEVWDLYAELGVERSATDDQLERAYRQRAKQVHPDKPGGSKEAFQRLFQAYEKLLDPETRAAHDRELAASAGGGAGRGAEQKAEDADPGDAASQADFRAEILARVTALRAVLGDCSPDAWKAKLASLPREADWSREVLVELASGKQDPVPKGGSADQPPVERQRGDDVAETGLTRRFERERSWRYEVRLTWNGVTIRTESTYDCDAAIAAHGAAVRLLRSATHLMEEAGKPIEEAAKAFEFPPVGLRFYFRQRVAGAHRATPTSSDLSLVLKHRKCLSDMLESGFSTKAITKKLASMREELRGIRQQAQESKDGIAEAAKKVLAGWPAPRGGRGGRGGTRGGGGGAATPVPRPLRRLIRKQALAWRKRKAAAMAGGELEDASAAVRRRLRYKQAADAAPPGTPALPAPPPPPPKTTPARASRRWLRSSGRAGSSMLALPPRSPELLDPNFASQVEEELMVRPQAGGGSGASASGEPSIALPWFSTACRVNRIGPREAEAILQTMQQSEEVKRFLQDAFCRARAA